MKSADLLAIVDFLYCVEANVYQENLHSFLAIAIGASAQGVDAINAINDGKSW